jgi:uncharacterized protein (TIGR02599 family)
MAGSSSSAPLMRPSAQRGNSAGFTLVEVLVATVILVIIVGILFSMTQATSNIWKNTTGKAEVFRSARAAFESMTRTLSQATLNTYYDYAITSGGTYTFVALGSASSTGTLTTPTNYARNSDLQIVSGQGSTLLPSLVNYTAVGHCVFFQAPIGVVSGGSSYSNLNSLVNACGFYVAYGPDSVRPGFLPTVARYRYRLMQFIQPADNLNIYALNTVTGKRTNWGTSNWFLPAVQADASATTPASDFVLAENVIALIILPKLSANDETAAENSYGSSIGPLGTALCPNYSYNSSTVGQGGGLNATTGLSQYPLLNSFNQLPPVIQVTMVALDEASATRLSSQLASPSSVTQANTKLGLTSTLFTQAKNFQSDLQQLENDLSAAPGNLAGNTSPYTFRVFQTEVSIRGAKWTSDN